MGKPWFLIAMLLLVSLSWSAHSPTPDAENSNQTEQIFCALVDADNAGEVLNSQANHESVEALVTVAECSATESRFSFHPQRQTGENAAPQFGDVYFRQPEEHVTKRYLRQGRSPSLC